MTDIILKQGTGVPSDTDLEVAEVAIDNSTGDMYTKLADGSVKQLNPEGGPTDWSEIENKPSEFPPASHNHDGVYQPVGDYISEAPNDGEEYARKNEGWVKLQDHNYTGADAVKITGDQSAAGHKTWTGLATFGQRVAFRDSVNGDTSANFGEDVTARSFIRSGGTSDQYLMADGSVSVGSSSNTLEGTWAYNASTAGNGEWTSRNADWLTITTVTLHKSDASGYEHNFVLMNAGDVMFIQAPTGGGEFNIVEKTVSGDTTIFTIDPIASYGLFPSAGDSTQINFIPQVSAGSNVTIGPNPPDPALEGMQWLEVPATPGQEATMWVHDGAKWLQHPGGKDGKDGADGLDGLWTDNGDGSITYQNATIAGYGMSLTGDQYINAANPDDSGGFTQWTNTSGSMSIGMAGEAANKLLIFDRKEGHVAADYTGGASGGWEFWANNQERMTINGDGDVSFKNATMSQSSTAVQAYLIQSNNAGCTLYSGVDGADTGLLGTSTGHSIAFMTNNVKHMTMDVNGRVDITGSLYVNGTPKISTVDLIKAFSKLRDAVKDEETVESLKESITNWIGGMIEEWESMQSPATQEIEK